MGDLPKAEEIYLKAVSQMNKVYKAIALNALGRFYENHKQRQKAENYYRKALAILNDFRDWNLEEQTMGNLARLRRN